MVRGALRAHSRGRYQQMSDRDGFIQNAAAAAADKSVRAQSDNFIHQTGCQRRSHSGEEKCQPLALECNFVNRMFAAFRKNAGKLLGTAFPRDFFNHLFEKTDDRALREAARDFLFGR